MKIETNSAPPKQYGRARPTSSEDDKPRPSRRVGRFSIEKPADPLNPVKKVGRFSVQKAADPLLQEISEIQDPTPRKFPLQRTGPTGTLLQPLSPSQLAIQGAINRDRSREGRGRTLRAKTPRRAKIRTTVDVEMAPPPPEPIVSNADEDEDMEKDVEMEGEDGPRFSMEYIPSPESSPIFSDSSECLSESELTSGRYSFERPRKVRVGGNQFYVQAKPKGKTTKTPSSTDNVFRMCQRFMETGNQWKYGAPKYSSSDEDD
ncbi:hypothetical protein SNEBB_010222 [Seison nebaliae]|nr:hypothetical protein SNEBB_010222 [Seison nebaliae]